MNRVRAVTPVVTAIATAAAGMILGTAPAYAARPAPMHAAVGHAALGHAAPMHAALGHAGRSHATKATKVTKASKATKRRASRQAATQAGMYVSVVKCSGRNAPVLTAPVTPSANLEFRNGTDPQNAKIVTRPPQAYSRVFTCTVVVLRKPGKPHRRHRVIVVLETGFGGEARSVARHHPAG